MASRKLSDSDKQNVAQLYCQPGETTSTLAKKFGVSSSTVSRVLKQVLSDDDYAKLMQWKRSGERGSLDLQLNLPLVESSGDSGTSQATTSLPAQGHAEVKLPEEDGQEAPQPSAKAPPKRRSRRRSATAASTVILEEDDEDEPEVISDMPPDLSKPEGPLTKKSRTKPQEEEANSDVAAWVSEGLTSETDYDTADEDDDEWDDDEWDDDAEEEEAFVPQPQREEALAILPVEDFMVKKPCYLVVDRMAELITCPLKEFAELGLIPEEEEKARTLPVFDNHRVARRFARRNQRIIKVPNGLMINKTQNYLQAKGITRLLFDGQVYALT
jgi:transposase-like protein